MYGFVLAFKGVLLEGLEVAFIVITFGSAQGSIPLAAGGAAAASSSSPTAGVLVRAPLARVPENTVKFAVGVMLTTFGIFWATEGAGANWPGGDAAILAVLAFVIALSAGLVGRAAPQSHRRRCRREVRPVLVGVHRRRRLALCGRGRRRNRADGRNRGGAVAAWWVLPVAVAAILYLSLRRVTAEVR